MENIPTHIKRILGLDLGIASVGWAVVELDEANNTGRLIDCGARTFPASGKPQAGESPNLPRRQARSARRRLYRLANRMKKIRQLFLQYGLVDDSYFTDEEPIIDENKGFQQIHQRVTKQATPYQLRAAGLQRQLTADEWVVVLTHLAKRRGYKSNSKRQDALDSKLTDKQKENKKAKAGIAANKALLDSYQTVGEMLYADEKFGTHKRNKAGDYNHSIHRDDLLQEITMLFDKQRTLGNPYATQQFEVDYKRVWEHQRHYDQEGKIAEMVGKCTFEKTEKRAPKHSYSAECFRLWQSINNLKIIDRDDKDIPITLTQKQKVAEKAWSTKNVTYKDVRSVLQLGDDIYNKRFKSKNLSYPLFADDNIEDPESELFVNMNGYHKIRSIFKKYIKQAKEMQEPITESWEQFAQNTERFDDIIEVLSEHKDDRDIRRELRQKSIDLSPLLMEQLLGCDVTGFMKLSFKAIKKIIPYLQEGLTYDKAVKKAGYGSHSSFEIRKNPKRKLPVINSDAVEDMTNGSQIVRNPMVLRPLAQARKVVNAVINKYGLVHQVHIELLRDFPKSEQGRKRIQKIQRENKLQQDSARKQYKEDKNGREPSGDQLLKYRLYREQGCYCPYSGQQICRDRLRLEDDYVEIDHIWPKSRSVDNSLNNKVLCLSDENRQKGNKIPYEYFMEQKSTQEWHEFVKRTSGQNYPKQKRDRLHRISFTKEEAQDWQYRTVEKTTSSYISKFFKEYLEKYLEFLPVAGANEEKRIKVQTRNGSLTSMLRKGWELQSGPHKNRGDGDQHHALDAIVVACATQKMVQHFSKYHHNRETHSSRINRLGTPWEEQHFHNEVAERLSTITVSRPPRKSTKGELHEATVYGKRNDTYIKCIKQVSSADVNKMIGRDGHGKELYETLVKQLEEKQKSVEQSGDKKTKVKIDMVSLQHPANRIHIEVAGDPIPISNNSERNRGYAERGGMVRIDIFSKPDRKGKLEFYFIPVYTHHFALYQRPIRVCQKNKLENEWPAADNSFTFLFRLHHDDYVRIVKKGGEMIEGYFQGANRANAQISIIDKHKKVHGSIGVKTLHSIKKYDISVLGEKHEIKREKRCEPVAKSTD